MEHRFLARSVSPQPVQDIAGILAEVRGLRAELDRFKKEHIDFAERTANEIDVLFAKVEATGLSWQETSLRGEGGQLPQTVVSHVLAMHETM